jgi:6-phosphogluconolactonase (cycloisomerase 2 family)
MTFKRWGRGILATAVSAGLGFGLASCSVSNTVDYLYMLSSKNNPGVINVYRVDSQTGALAQIPNSPYPAGRNPLGIAIAPNGLTLYVVNHDDNTIESFGIGTDAKLYPQHTYTTPGSEPVALAINAAGTFLFVVDYYQPVYTDLNPGPGAVVVYPINSDGSLGTAVAQNFSSTQSESYYPLETAPVGINIVASGDEIFITDLLLTTATGGTIGQGAVEALSVSSSGVLTPVTGSPYPTGVTPNTLTTNPAGTYLYVTDTTQNELISYPIHSDGTLATSSATTAATGSYPDGLTFDATGKYLYVVNRNSNNIQGYTIASGTGAPVAFGSFATGAYPECVLVDPNLNTFVYTADFEGVGSTGYRMDHSTGMLSGTENSPYGGTGQATCLAATPHNKSSQSKGTT